MGEPNGRPDSSPEIQGLYFDVISRVARAEVLNGDAMTIQWRFDDADPWHLRIDNGSSAAAPGLAPDARRHDRDELGRLDRDLAQG